MECHITALLIIIIEKYGITSQVHKSATDWGIRIWNEWASSRAGSSHDLVAAVTNYALSCYCTLKCALCDLMFSQVTAFKGSDWL